VTVLRALIDEAVRKNYQDGVIGVRARPLWTETGTFDHNGVTVHVVPCVSALAVREALLDQQGGTWLMLLTDRPDDDLGYGILSRLLWHRLRTPDPWDAVRLAFAATGLDAALTSGPGHRDLATGLLAVGPAAPNRWPAAPGGVLTRDHAVGSVVAARLGIPAPVDVAAVLAWTTRADAATHLADLRSEGGNALADAVLGWLATRCGVAAAPVRALLLAGEVRDVVPLGLVVGVLEGARAAAGSQGGDEGQLGLVRLEPRLGGAVPSSGTLTGWAREAAAAVRSLLAEPASRPAADRLLARADDLLEGCHAAALAGLSADLPSGLRRRIEALAGALRAAADVAGAGGQAVISAEEAVEVAWRSVSGHRLSATDRRVPPFRAAVRLVRWLAVDAGGAAAELGRAGRPDAATSLPALARRYLDVEAWADAAVNDAAGGVGDSTLGAVLSAVLAAVRRVRDAHDVGFAQALADHTRGDPAMEGAQREGVWYLEDVLAGVVVPLALTVPTTLLVLDGLSAAVAAELLTDVTARRASGWVEALVGGQERRIAALAVLPTLTSVSRSSLLCGQLQVGDQVVEQRGLAEAARAHGLTGSALFFKKDLDTSRPGHEIADAVGAAIDDTEGKPLVACVLNTIDDALDRSDPAGTDWTAESVKHLLPLLDRSRLAGRAVVITSDHGHVIERREGTQRPFPDLSSRRSRAAESPAGEGEVLIEGRRVMAHGARAVLAVDERLRYGALKAGYHGGASPAEVVVPVVVLVPGVVPQGVPLEAAPPQQPAWWDSPATAAPVPAGVAGTAPAAAPSATRTDRRPRTSAAGEPPAMLFDVPPADAGATIPAAAAASGQAPAVASGSAAAVLAQKVVGSAVFAGQKQLAGRVVVKDAQVLALLTALLGAGGGRLGPTQVATALVVPVAGVRGAVAQVQRLLNVDSYAVLRLDVDGATVVLDESLLREQFEVG